MMRFMRCLMPAKRVTRPELEPEKTDGATAHHRALESLYRSAPINRSFPSELEIVEDGFAR